jgi:guanylate kinase
MSRGKLVVIVAPSGTGKSTLIKRVMEKETSLKWSVSCTTRKIRDGEVHGKDYFFTEKTQFEKNVENNDFIEWATVHSNYYGTLKSFVDKGLEDGTNLIFDLDVQGCDQMKEIYGDEARIIFIRPPSLESLKERLLKRGTDPIEVINERLNNAKSELKRSDDFDYVVINDDIEQAYKDLLATVQSILES